MSSTQLQTIETHHTESLHDAELDYFGKRLATCSSDKTIKIFDVTNGAQTLIDTLRGHDGPVWQLSWAHPKFGTILASAGYDGKVIIWRESQNQWSKLTEHILHSASVNSVSWAPHELGAILACASSDGKVSVLEFKDDGTWDTRSFGAHGLGVNAVSWAPSMVPGSAVSTIGTPPRTKRFVTGGCDNLVKIWVYDTASQQWSEESRHEGHEDWVRDVAWAPNIGLSKSYIASAGQDKQVLIWTRIGTQAWQKTQLKESGFADVVWRVSWSESGNLLAVSCGDGKIYVYKETGHAWEEVSTVTS